MAAGYAERYHLDPATAASDAADFRAQWIEMVRANTNASLDFAHQLAIRELGDAQLGSRAKQRRKVLVG